LKCLFSRQTIKIYHMPESGILLDYHGPVNLKVIELLLKKLKSAKEFKVMSIITGKRVYGLVVECLENIYKNQIILTSTGPKMNPRISVKTENDKIYIVAGNPVSESVKESLIRRLEQINNLDEAALKTLYEHKINRDSLPGENGAGLGFIYMVLKSENKIGYTFEPLIKGYLYFEIKISL